MKSINGVLFDLDGTLVDNFQAIYQAYLATAEQYGWEILLFADLKKLIGGSAFLTLTRAWGEQRAKECFPSFRKHFQKLIFHKINVYSGVQNFIEELDTKGFKIAIYTNKHAVSARRITEHLGWNNLFQQILGAHDTDWIKPEPKLSAYLLGLLELNPENTLMVGDSPYDSETAHKAGMLSWNVTTGTHSRGELENSDFPPHEIFSCMKSLRDKFFQND